MTRLQKVTSKVSDERVGPEQDLSPQPSSQPPKSEPKNLDTNEAFCRPSGPPGSTSIIASSNTEYVDKPAIVNKLDDGKMKLELPLPKK